MNVAYVRVSTVQQNEDRQVSALGKYDIEKWFTEKVSGKDMNRPKLQEMLNFVREGDTIFITELSRLARSTLDLYKIAGLLDEKKVNLISMKENIDFSTATGKMLFGLLAVLAQFERDLIRERQAEGIAVAKAQGKKLGRPRVEVPEDIFDGYYNGWKNRLYSIAEISRKLRISTATVYRLISAKKEMEKKNLRTD